MTQPQKDTSRAGLLPELRDSLMKHLPVPMAELAGARHIIRVGNDAFCRLVGKHGDVLVGKPFSQTVQEGDRCLEVLDRVYRTGLSAIHTESEQAEPRPVYWSYTMWPVLDAWAPLEYRKAKKQRHFYEDER